MNELDLKIENQLDQLCETFLKKNITLGFAESCTGGLLSALLVSRSGVSSFFMGSIVSYSGKVKRDVLGVPQYAIESYGEVSVPVAQYMAKGARQILGVDWALSITGVAGPGGGSKDKPVGTVCFALCGPGVEKKLQRYFDGNNRNIIQRQSALYGLELVLNNVNGIDF